MELLSLKNVSVGYDGKAVAENISFSLNRGDYLCIIGENGAGKSTLMKTLLSLKAPVSGEIRFADGFLKTQIGYLPQQTDVQKDFPATVFEVALSGCLNECGLRPFYSKAQKCGSKGSIYCNTKKEATVRFPAVSSKGCCLRAPSAPQTDSFSWTSLPPVLTRL